MVDNESVVLTDIFLGRFLVSDFLAVFNDKIQINILHRGTINRFVLVIADPLAYIAAAARQNSVFGFVAHTVIYFVLLVSV